MPYLNKSLTRLALIVLALYLIPLTGSLAKAGVFVEFAVNVMLMYKDIPSLLSERENQKHPSSIEHEECLARLEQENQRLYAENQRLWEEVQRLKPPEAPEDQA